MLAWQHRESLQEGTTLVLILNKYFYRITIVAESASAKRIYVVVHSDQNRSSCAAAIGFLTIATWRQFTASKRNTIDKMQEHPHLRMLQTRHDEKLSQLNSMNSMPEFEKQNLIIVESAFPDLNDFKLDQALINIFNKKKMSFISVKRLNDDNYEFGTLKVQIKFDGDIIRGKF